MNSRRLVLCLGLCIGLLVVLTLGSLGGADVGQTVHAENGPQPKEPTATNMGKERGTVADLTPRAYLPLVRKPPPPIYLPIVLSPYASVGPPLPPPVLVTGTHPIDFGLIRSDLQANGQEMAFVKIGFHVGPGGNVTGLVDALTALDTAGVPFIIKSVDQTGQGFYDAHALAQASDVPHTLVYRKSGVAYDTPNYALDPKIAAQQHWAIHVAAWPPELDPSIVWMETVNEVDRGRSEWLAEFALETAQLALDSGRRWAAFGWSSGEPEVVEPKDWEGAKMLEFLQLAAAHPGQIAIALHEYSYTVDDIAAAYPYLVGRLQFLFDTCDRYGIARPTVLITEWGWEYQHVPGVPEAMEDIAWASWLYAAYPQVQGAAIWYLGKDSNWPDIANEAQQLIAPLKDYALSHYYVIEQGQGGIDPEIFRP